jgi:hypothetical protein
VRELGGRPDDVAHSISHPYCTLWTCIHSGKSQLQTEATRSICSVRVAISKHANLYYPCRSCWTRLHPFLVSPKLPFTTPLCMLLSFTQEARAGDLTAQALMATNLPMLGLARYKPQTRRTCAAWGKSNNSGCVPGINCLFPRPDRMNSVTSMWYPSPASVWPS